jgi:hypothetical protein
MNDDLQKHTLFLRRGDFEKLGALFPELPPSAVIRKLVADAIERIEKGTVKPELKVDMTL